MARRKKRSRAADAKVESASSVGVMPAIDGGIRFREWAALAAIAIVTLLAYLPAVRGSLIWDDDAHVTKPELRSAAGLYRIWFEIDATQQYYPLLHTAFWLEHKLWGDNVVGYHLTNIVLHAAVACLVFVLLRQLDIPGALLAAAIFAIHPVHVESVAWISEQKNTLSAIFYLSAMLTYLRFDETRRSSPYAISFGLFVLGLLCKTVTATLPAALLVIFWWKRGELTWRRDVVPLLPFFAVGAVAGLFTAWVERTLIGAQGAEHELRPVERGLLAGRVPWFYLSKLLWPANLMFIYPRWNIDSAIWWQWFFPLATIAFTALLFAVRGWSRAPVACWLLFVGTLFPVLGFLNVYPFLFSFVANHFQYLASLAVIALVGAVAMMAVKRLSAKWRWVGYGLCLAILAGLTVRTWQESRVYSDVATLYQTTIDRNPTCWLAFNNLGFEFARRGDAPQAIAHYQEALRLNPRYSVAHYNLANQLGATGSTEEAMEHYRRAIEIRPTYPEAHNNLGTIFLRQGNARAAVEQFTLASRYNPFFADAESNLGFALLATGEPMFASRHFQRAIELDADHASAHKGLGDVLFHANRSEAAIVSYRQSLRLQPESADAHNSLGVALAKSNNAPEAITHFQTAARLAGHDPAAAITAYANLTRAYVQSNRRADAIDTAEVAVEFARKHGRVDTANEIAAWLKNYRTEAAGEETEETGE